MEQHLADVVGYLNLSPVGSDAKTPKASHTNPGVDFKKFADFFESKWWIGGFKTAISNKPNHTFTKNPTVARLGFFI